MVGSAGVPFWVKSQYINSEQSQLCQELSYPRWRADFTLNFPPLSDFYEAQTHHDAEEEHQDGDGRPRVGHRMKEVKGPARLRTRVISQDSISVESQSGAAEPDQSRFGADQLAEVRRPLAEAVVAVWIPPEWLNCEMRE